MVQLWPSRGVHKHPQIRIAAAAMVGSSEGFATSRRTTLLILQDFAKPLSFYWDFAYNLTGRNGNQALLATSFDPPKRPVLWLNLKSGYSRPLTSINHKFFKDTYY